MFRAAVRSTPRALRQSSVVASATGRRFASTAPADKSHTWKGAATRWSLALGALYWYNTSPIFADDVPSHLSSEPPHFSESDLPTVDAIVEEKRRQLDARLKTRGEQAAEQTVQSPQAPPPQNNESTAVATPEDLEKSPEQLEEEAGNQGAFNPETGEINWDCPCLGGMAHGPCGEEFKAAFSCFVYSNEEPKGIDCVDKFQHMQDCFRQYPDIYGAEIADEEAAEAEAAAIASGSPVPTVDDSDTASKDVVPAEAVKAEEKPAETPKQTPTAPESTTDAPKENHPATAPVANEVSDATVAVHSLKEVMAAEEHGVPTKSFDATSANKTASK